MITCHLRVKRCTESEIHRWTGTSTARAHVIIRPVRQMTCPRCNTGVYVRDGRAISVLVCRRAAGGSRAAGADSSMSLPAVPRAGRRRAGEGSGWGRVIETTYQPFWHAMRNDCPASPAGLSGRRPPNERRQSCCRYTIMNAGSAPISANITRPIGNSCRSAPSTWRRRS